MPDSAWCQPPSFATNKESLMLNLYGDKVTNSEARNIGSNMDFRFNNYGPVQWVESLGERQYLSFMSAGFVIVVGSTYIFFQWNSLSELLEFLSIYCPELFF